MKVVQTEIFHVNENDTLPFPTLVAKNQIVGLIKQEKFVAQQPLTTQDVKQDNKTMNDYIQYLNTKGHFNSLAIQQVINQMY